MGTLAGINGLTNFFIGPVMGYVSDKYDRAKVLHFSSLLGFLAIFCTSFAIFNDDYKVSAFSSYNLPLLLFS